MRCTLQIIFIFLLLQISAFGQELCGTEFSPEAQTFYLEHKEARQAFDISAETLIPQTFAITYHYVRANGPGVMDPFLHYITNNYLNDKFASIDLQFSTKWINYIDDDNFYEVTVGEANMIADEHDVDSSINIYFFHDLTDYCGYASYPLGSDRIFLDIDCLDSPETILHQMGHFLSLLHTHGPIDGVMTSELVDGSNCADAGDNICDTPADPQLSSLNVNTDCQYTGDLTDAYGYFFDPDPHNLMSYSRMSCLNSFTPMQWNEMAYTAQYVRNYLDWKPWACEFPFDVGAPAYLVTDQSILMSWFQLGPPVVSYEVQAQQVDPCCGPPITDIASDDVYYFEGLNPGTTYNLRMRSICAINDDEIPSIWVDIGNITTHCNQTMTPGGLVSDVVNAQKAELSWDKLGGAEKYIVQIRETSSGTIRKVILDETARTINNLEPGETYEWRLKALCSYDPDTYCEPVPYADPCTFSRWSTIQTFSTDECTRPANLSSNVHESGEEVTISWDPAAGDVLQYKYFYRETGDDNWIKDNTPESSVILTGLVPNTGYEWRVKSQCAYGWTGFGEIGEFFTGGSASCTYPEGMYEMPASISANLYWNPVSEAFKYCVKYREPGTSVWTYFNTYETTMLLDNLLPGNTYEWKVRSKCPDGNWTDFSQAREFTTILSDVLIRKDINPEPDLRIHPNPVNDMSTITWDQLSDAEIVIEVIDLDGRKFLRQHYEGIMGRNSEELDMSDLSPGLFIIRVRGEEFQAYVSVLKI